MPPAYLVTGANGCIGAWVVKLLLQQGRRPVVFDRVADPRRLELLLDAAQLEKVVFLSGDITESGAVERALLDSGAEHIIHLAGLQVPFCAADPVRGAMVNVVGTVEVFEAARRAANKFVVYASSAAVYGPGAGEAVTETDRCEPTTHYGVYKCANEGNARIYFQDAGVSSVGLRPLTVYGVGRDQGLTSDVTKAMKAAVVEEPFTIRFSGKTDLIHARDAAAAFVAAADQAPVGAHVCNLHGDTVAIDAVVEEIHRHASSPCIDVAGEPLPIPPRMVDDRLIELLGDLPRTPFADGVIETMQHFRQLQREGRLTTDELAV